MLGRVRLAAYCTLILLTFAATAYDAISFGWNAWMPGSMIRHRDAIAVAISHVGYGKTDGAAYKAVNRALLDSGFDVRASGYLVAMRDHRVGVALTRAAALADPAAEGDYFPFEETGVARLYTLAFAIFGIAAASWFWLYVSLLALSAGIAIVALRRHPAALYVILCAVAAHAVVAVMLPRLAQHDVMVITSNRFLGILGSVAALQVMLMVVCRVSWSPWQALGLILQGLLLAMLITARVTATWLAFALISFAIFAALSRRPWRQLWPLALVAVVIAAGIGAERLAAHHAYRDGSAASGHVFWHNFLTALHNHPDRMRYGIAPNIVPYDDLVAFIQFDAALKTRGETRDAYLLKDRDWMFRTTEPAYDFNWTAYDRVMRSVTIDTLRTDPAYAVMSFAVYQPAAAARQILALTARPTAALPLAAMTVLLLLGGILLRPHITAPILAATLCLVLASGLPVAAAGVAELRVIELFFAWIFGLGIVITMAGTGPV